MDPVALWEQLVMQAKSLLRTTDAIAQSEEEGRPPDSVDLDELKITAANIAMQILDIDEWIETDGFSPFEKEDQSARETADLERELEYREPHEED